MTIIKFPGSEEEREKHLKKKLLDDMYFVLSQYKDALKFLGGGNKYLSTHEAREGALAESLSFLEDTCFMDLLDIVSQYEADTGMMDEDGEEYD